MSARFVIQGELELLTPLHLGDGGEDRPGSAQDDPWIATVARAHDDRPCVPGSSLKGALRALALRLGCDPEWMLRVFGSTEQAGAVVFLWSWISRIPDASGLPGYRPDKALAQIPHTAVDRDTRTVVSRKLFTMPVVPPGARFAVRLRCRGLAPAEVQQLLWLLQCCGDDDARFGLGSGHGAHRCRVQWVGGAQRVRRFGPQQVNAWLAALAGADPGPWVRGVANFAVPRLLASPPGAVDPAGASAHVLSMQVRLEFWGPFLVGQRDNDAQGELLAPRLSHEGQVELADTAFIGPLRAQCERILRTLGLPTRQGHEAAALPPGEPFEDLAAVLFGAAGWAAVVTAGAFVPAPGAPAPLRDQHFVAIDRVGAGGKDSAKFRISRPDGPVLQGRLQLDWRRLQRSGRAREALGLLALALRDLQEGDIAFGHGRSKGFGTCTATGLLGALELLISEREACLTLATCLEALRAGLPADVLRAPQMAAPQTPPIDWPAPLQARQADPNEFLNPYAWLPLTAPDSASWQRFDALPGSIHSHARYAGLSGRLVFELRTVTPTFVGGERASRQGLPPTEPTTVQPFTLLGERAIPATSLRGVISSIHESLNASNMRVLEDDAMSVRVGVGEGISAFGRIHRRADGYWLEPLTLPTIHRKANGYPIPPGFDRAFANFPVGDDSVAPLRAYFDAPAGAYKACEPCYWALEWAALEKAGDADPVCVSQANRNALRFPSTDAHEKYLIGCKPWAGASDRPLTHAEWEGRGRPDGYLRGYARTLVAPGRSLPHGVRHWQFIPHPAECDAMDDSERGLMPIPPDVLARFQRLADEVCAGHTRASTPQSQLQVLPYTPVGRDGPPRTAENGYRTELADGDLMLFDVDAQGAVREIAFSSIWRREVGSTVSGFVQHESPDLLPWGMAALRGAPRRDALSPSELMFGAVEDMGRRPEGDASGDRQGRAFAAKVRIGFGRAVAPVNCLPAVTLKELSARKLPAPALNFRRAAGGGGHISKSALVASPAAFRLKGKRIHLHALRNADGDVRLLDDRGRPATGNGGRAPWRSCHDGHQDPGNLRRVRVEPIAPGEPFYFEVDFDNLDAEELQQLCAAFMPAPGFEHRLGMGKPIGLGSVRIQALGLFIVDRWKRYGQDALDAARYAAHGGGGMAAVPGLPKHLTAEQALLSHAGTLPSPADLAQAGMAGAPCSPATRRALYLAGVPGHVTVPVHYPARAGQQLEHEHFNWFVQNDNGRDQQLGDIDANSTRLPTLRRN